MEKQLEKQHPTNLEVDEAYGMIRKFKRYYKFDEDDIQTVMLKFFQTFNSNKNEIKPYLILLCKQHNVTKWYRQGQKRTATSITHIDANESLDWQRYLTTDDVLHLELEEEKQHNIQLVEKYLDLLLPTQRYVIVEHYFKEVPILKIAEELGISRQAVHQRIQSGFNKIKSKQINK